MLQQTPAEMTGNRRADQLAKALASFVRAEFEAPVHVVSGFVDLLIEDARQNGMNGYLADLDKIKASLETKCIEFGDFLNCYAAGYCPVRSADLSPRSRGSDHTLGGVG